jgi:RNA polymerase sigma factor (sigma-70 family)
MSNSAEVATAGEGDSPESLLTDEQRTAFWAGIVSNRDPALRMARRFVSRHTAEDVVDTAAILFIESLQRPRKPARFPKTDQDFRRRYLAIVRNHAIDCVRNCESGDRPVHSHWGEEPEPVVGGRKVADRALDQVFSRIDDGEYDAPAPPRMREKDRPDELNQMLRCHLSALPRMQRQVVDETFLGGKKRADIARRLGISVNTYDNHLQAGFRALRHLLSQDADIFTDVDRSVWYDLIEELRERYEGSRARRVSRRPRELSTSERDLSNSARDLSRSARDVPNSEGAAANSERATSNAARDGDKSSRIDAA